MSRSIFEEVDAERATDSPPPRPGAADARKAADRRRIALWLLALAGLVIAQIVLGGLTRITDSGLSITDWRPLTGVLPPLSEADWARAFSEYKTTDEYRLQNAGMTLAEFQTIFWWEWAHRMMGRAIGLAFAIPFAIFLWKKAIPTGWTGRIAFLGLLGGFQGLVGWWMVRSGLEREGLVDVAPEWLAFHLSMAFLIVGLLLWHALSLRRAEWELLQARRRREKPLFILGGVLAAVTFLQVVMGAFVSGMDAGLVYPTWPLMNGAFYPPNEPFAPFSEPAAAQFAHRLLAYLLVVAAIVFFWRLRGSAFAASRRWGVIVLGLLAVQITLGIAAVVHLVPWSLAALHQLGAVVLFLAVIHAKHQLAFPKEEKIADGA